MNSEGLIKCAKEGCENTYLPSFVSDTFCSACYLFEREQDRINSRRRVKQNIVAALLDYGIGRNANWVYDFVEDIEAGEFPNLVIEGLTNDN